MRASGWTPTFRCWGSKRLDWGLAQVRRAKELDQLPGHVVMALGTNDISWESRSTNERRVREMLRLLGKQRQVLWLDVDTTYSNFSIAAADWFNAMIRRVANEYPNVKVVPWKRTARTAGVKRPDGIHYGPDGYRLRAQTVVEALNAAARPSASPLASSSPSPSVSSSPTASLSVRPTPAASTTG